MIRNIAAGVTDDGDPAGRVAIYVGTGGIMDLTPAFSLRSDLSMIDYVPYASYDEKIMRVGRYNADAAADFTALTRAYPYMTADYELLHLYFGAQYCCSAVLE